MSGIDQLLLVASTYAAAVNVPLTTVSSRVFDDSKKLPALADGNADIQVKRLEAAMRWFAENWPEGTRWPRSVPRPTPAPVVAPGIGASA